MTANPVDQLGRGGRPLVLAYLPSILAITALVLLSAQLAIRLQAPMYQSVARIAVEPVVITNGPNPQPPDMGTERELATSGQVLTAAASRLQLSPRELADGLSVNVPVSTHVLRFAYKAPNAAAARQRAAAVASAYLAYRNAESAVGSVSAPASTLAHAYLITPASLPDAPARANSALVLLVGALVGFFLGLAVAALRDHLTGRVRDVDTLEEISGAPVFATIGHQREGGRVEPARLATDLTPPVITEAGYGYLGTKVLRLCHDRQAKRVLVSSPGAGEGTSVTAASLAVTLASPHRRVILVSGDIPTPESGTVVVTQQDGVAPFQEEPWLEHVLASTCVPGLQVLNARRAHAESALSTTIGLAASHADLVVIDAGALLTRPDSLALVGAADVVMLVADARRTHRNSVREALRQLQQVGRRIDGAVLNNAGGAPFRRRTSPERTAQARHVPTVIGRAGGAPSRLAPWKAVS
ncbi:MAG: ywqD [Frankiales bacterium]|nr:ywqD [Frankiales bacterium]